MSKCRNLFTINSFLKYIPLNYRHSWKRSIFYSFPYFKMKEGYFKFVDISRLVSLRCLWMALYKGWVKTKMSPPWGWVLLDLDLGVKDCIHIVLRKFIQMLIGHSIPFLFCPKFCWNCLKKRWWFICSITLIFAGSFDSDFVYFWLPGLNRRGH